MSGAAYRRDELNLIKNNFSAPVNNNGGGIFSALLDEAAFINASDLHISAGMPIFLRINGELIKLSEVKNFNDDLILNKNLILNSEQINNELQKIISPDKYKFFTENYELDFGFFSYGEKSGKIRVRGSCYHDINGISIAFRILPVKIPNLDELNLPKILKEIAKRRSGLFLTAGAAGNGKSTTLAALINEINNSRREHIITIEDPVEYIHEPNLCLIHQREVSLNTKSFYSALKYALRQDPNVIMIGEMRDAETISAAVTAAETGHLVLSSLHTQDAAQGVERLVAAFPADKQNTARVQISSVLAGIFTQRLIPVSNMNNENNKRICAAEICIANNAVKNCIRDGRTHNLRSIIQTGLTDGMQTLEQSLADLVHKKILLPDTALNYANYPAELDRIF